MKIKPIRANLEITDICNLRCRHCYNPKNKTGYNTSDMVRIIKKLDDEGIFEISIGGGEPLCFPGIKKILKLATRKMYTILTSNGLLMSDEFIKFLSKLNNLTLQISLDGAKENHNYIRNTSFDAFKKTDKIIDEIVKKKINLQIGFMLSHRNIIDLKYVFQYCLQKGITIIAILPYIGSRQDFKLDQKDMNKAILIIQKYKSKIHIKIRDPYISNRVFKDNKQCWAGWLTFNIDCRGEVSPCSYLPIYLGNIFEIDFNNIKDRFERKIIKLDRSRCGVLNYE